MYKKYIFIQYYFSIIVSDLYLTISQFMPMVKNSTLFYLVDNTGPYQNYVLTDDSLNKNGSVDEKEILSGLDNVEFDVKEEILERIIDYARKFTV